MHRPTRSGLTLFALVMLGVMLTTAGCASGGASELKDVTDPGSLFHFKVPTKWQHTATSDVLVVYAADKLPDAGEPVDTLTVFVFPSGEASATPVAEELRAIIESRAVSRAWQDYSVGESADITVGNRPAVSIRTSGTDGQGVQFEAEFILVRAAGKAVGIMSVAPAGTLEEYRADLDLLLGERWFWHVAADATSTPAP
ncbi:MAG: hypothetical protein ACYC77_01970 [Coriobacteriia bacterium]